MSEVERARDRYRQLIAMRKEAVTRAEKAQALMRQAKREGDAMAAEMRRLKEFIDTAA